MSSFHFNITATRGNPSNRTMVCPNGTVVQGTTKQLCEIMVQQMRFPEHGTVVTRDAAGEILEGSPRPPLDHRLISDVKATIDGREFGSLAIFAPDAENRPVYGPVLPSGDFFRMPPPELVVAAEARIEKRKKLSARKSEGRPAIYEDFPLREPVQWPADAKDGDDTPLQPHKTVRTMKTTKKSN